MRFLITIFCLLILILGTAPAAAAHTFPAAGLTSDSTAPVPEPSGIGIQLLEVPAATQDDPRARSYIVDRLAPGTEINRRIQVQNNSDTVQSVRVYPGAAHIEGGSFVGEDDPAENELTSWITVDQPQLELRPGEAAEVTVTIDVPADAAEGERYAAVWAEIRNPATGDEKIIQASRAGIRIYLAVGAGNGKPADFNITSLTAARDRQGNPQVTAMVTNTGGRALDVTGDLMLSDGPGGLSAGPFSVERATTIAPGGQEGVTISLSPELPNGPWTAQLRLQSGLVEHVAEASITFPDAGEGETVKPVEESSMSWIIIGLALAGILLIAAGLLWWIRRRNFRTNR